MSKPKPAPVFISHATIDSDVAMRLKGILDRLGLRSFVYEHSQRAGQNRFEVIGRRIKECSYMVVLLTKKARASQWVNQEIGYGAALNKVIVPVVQVDGVRRRRIPYFGFTELSDPVSLSMIAPEGGISDLLRTLTARALDDRSWTGQVKIKCACGYNGAYRARRLTVWRWDCRRCGQKVSVSPVTYEPLP